MVETSEFIRLKDEFQKQRVGEGKYEWKNERFVGGWTQKIQVDFIDWLKNYRNRPMTMKDLEPYLNKIKIE